MQTYHVHLQSDPSSSFRCNKAANSLDIDIEEKLTHKLTVDVDLESDFNIGLIVGSSGSGKTTLAKRIFGDDVFRTMLADDQTVLDQFPDSMSYEECQKLLNGVGLTQVPCWIRPAYTLSNGQRARAEIALQMARSDEMIAIDEWTSVVDRTVAKVMSHCIGKFARRYKRRTILCSCHYDIVEWVKPDWIIDCNKQTFRRCLRRNERKEKIHFDVRRLADGRSWKNFSRYHYLNENLPGGHIELWGLFHGQEQIGFNCFANYVPYRAEHKRKGERKKMHSNRTVIHPDYVGFGLGMMFINISSAMMHADGFDIWGKFSSAPVARGIQRYPSLWKLRDVKRQLRPTVTGDIIRKTGYREKVRTFSYQWIGGDDWEAAAQIAPVDPRRETGARVEAG